MNVQLALDTALAPVDLLRVQAWFSPAFPVGSFSYSHGLEWTIESGSVQDGPGLVRWIEGLVRHGSGRSDLILVGQMWRAIRSGDWPRAREIMELAAALQPSHERQLESLGQGTAFVSAVAAAWPHPTLERFTRAFPGETALPIAVGLAAAAHRLPLAPVLTASLHAFTAHLVSAGVRLIPLGQTDGLKALAALAPVVLEVSSEALDLGL